MEFRSPPALDPRKGKAFPHDPERPPWRREWRKYGKALGFLLLTIVLGLSFLFAATGIGSQRPPSPLVPPSKPLPKEDVRLSSPLAQGVPRFERIVDGKYTENRDAYRFFYTVDPALQMSVNEILLSYRPPYSTYVALDPRTGKILALADYARENHSNGGVWQKATYPAASIFKLVTAASALEKGILNYDSPVSYRGNLYRLGPQKLTVSPKRDRQMSFDEALGKSNNVVFGRVASHLVGSETLKKISEAFGFNHPLSFDFPLDMSRALIPDSFYELARCGAGFGEVTLNPLHAAMIAACIANRGVMMKPYLTEEIYDARGARVHQARPEPVGQPISPKTAMDLSRMMLRTVEDGTAAKVFHRYGKALTSKVSVCGKTGSLSGQNPPGLYDWFIGFAPGENPQIAFAAMVINHQRGRIKGAFVAEEALKTLFREQIH